MLAYRRADVDELNRGRARAHAPRRRLGRRRRHARRARVPGRRPRPLPPQRRPARCPQRHPRHRHRPRRRRAHVATDTRRRPQVPLAYAAEHLDHGYALTGHAAQGATVDRAFVLLHDQGALQEWGYVACTRARTETRLYLADRDRSTRDAAPPADPTAPAERVARALQRSVRRAARPRPAQTPRYTILNFGSPSNRGNSTGSTSTRPHSSPPPTRAPTACTGGTATDEQLETEIACHEKTIDRGEAKAEQLRRKPLRGGARSFLAFARPAPRARTLAGTGTGPPRPGGQARPRTTRPWARTADAFIGAQAALTVGGETLGRAMDATAGRG